MDDALQPPPGGRQNRGTAFLVVVLVFTIVAWGFVTPRIYIRAFVKRTFGWDDAFVVLSLVSSPAHARRCREWCTDRTRSSQQSQPLSTFPKS